MNMSKHLAFLAILASLAACSTWDKLDNKERGAVIGVGSGAAVGAVAGGGTGAIIGGAGGGLAGGLIGNEMDKKDRDRDRNY
ncbi:MAG: hypothetical protein J0M12_00960 [Deltaproteobacteria bacterium]|nr:hypothetical protein [Deltaproteobacteria bacterium]